MNILFIYERRIIPNFGGVERVTILLAEELKKRGHDVTFLSVGPFSWNTGNEEFGFPQFYLPFSGVESAEKINELIANLAIDRIICQGTHNSVVSLLPHLPKNIWKGLVIHNKPYAWFGHEKFIAGLTSWQGLPVKEKIRKLAATYFTPLYAKKMRKKSQIRMAFMVSHTDKLILLSRRYEESVAAYTPGLDRNKLASVNNPNTFLPTEELSISEKENIVLLVGRLSNPQKNITGFIDVWKEFQQNHPDWTVLILGDGEDREYIKRYAENKKVTGLKFLGNRPDIASYYKKAKILCMTSTYEGWPMVLPEAMAYGCVPVVYDSFAAVRDLIENGVNGYVVQFNDIDAMQKALSVIANDDGKRLSMAENGRLQINKFKVENIVDDWENLLNSPR